MRNYYVLTYHDCDEHLTVSDYKETEFVMSMFWNMNLFQGNIPEDVELYISDGVQPDYVANPLSWIIVSEKFFCSLEPLIGNDVQRFPAPLYHENSKASLTGFYVLNLTRALDILAEPLQNIQEMVLRRNAIPIDAHFFCIKGHETVFLVSQEFVEIVRQHKLRGMAVINTKSVEA